LPHQEDFAVQPGGQLGKRVRAGRAGDALDAGPTAVGVNPLEEVDGAVNCRRPDRQQRFRTGGQQLNLIVVARRRRHLLGVAPALAVVAVA
jgi:hypothetical protein